MAIIFHCPECDKEYRVDRSKAGKKGKCKECGNELRVPVPQEGIPETGDVELSPSGSLVYRHEERKIPFQPTMGDSENIELISDHIEEHLGPVAGVLHEIVSDLVHIDIHVVEPTEENPVYRLVTSGMSEAPMNVPEGAEDFRFAELMVTLPGDWPMEQSDWEDEANYWPLRWLKMLARFPHEYDTWLGYGHTIPNGDPPEPFDETTKLCCALLLVSPTVPDEFLTLEVSPEKAIHFYSFIPLYEEEVRFKLDKGVDDLTDRFDKHGIDDMINPQRKNVCSRSWKLW
ncbi:MAG: suppressor of fused domain protein [Planctomycetaceae bacterium]|nr:suppressor of fused domain protein [Planctomycetaceae bacterium]